MNNVHGIIYAYHNFQALNPLGNRRTGASMPFCSRYRLIDFALSSLMNAGIHDVGVIMQRDYQSLLDHIGNGRTWDMSKIAKGRGMRILPPFGLPSSHKGVYEGCMEALNAVSQYIGDIKQEYVILIRGDMCASIDIAKVVEQHIESGVDITAVCSDIVPENVHHRFVPGEGVLADKLLCRVNNGEQGVAALEVYVMKTKMLQALINWCSENNKMHFHRDALPHLMENGAKVGIYMHNGYSRIIISVHDYFQASMAMLDAEKRSQIFDEERKVATKTRSDVSTYYGDDAKVVNSLIGDGCIIEGTVENCVIFRGAKVGKKAHLKNCIVLQDGVIEENVVLNHVICDKNVVVSEYVTLTGNEKLPLVVPKDTVI